MFLNKVLAKLIYVYYVKLDTIKLTVNAGKTQFKGVHMKLVLTASFAIIVKTIHIFQKTEDA